MTSSNPKKVFVVGSQQVRVRPQPSRNYPESRWLQPGERIESELASRTEAEGHVWWKHAEGWTAERSLDGKYTYLTEVVAPTAPPPAPAAPTVAPVGVPAPPPASMPAPPAAPAPIPAGRRTFQVGTQAVRMRPHPSRVSAESGWLQPGQLVECETASRTQAEGFVWWKHSGGWSAERSLDGANTYLYEPGKAPVPAAAPAAAPTPAGGAGLDTNTLPLRETLFKRLPVDLPLTRWWQYFGNNCYAQQIWAEGKRWYEYCQGLHGGLDFGNSTEQGVLIFAGVEGGRFDRLDTRFTLPNGLWVKVGDYTIIYGHVANPRPFNPGDPIGVDTVMGELEFGPGLQNHLHLEVRYNGTWVVNPLLFFPMAMQDQIIGKFPPGPSYFYADAGWNRWQKPYDQPPLRLGGMLIGPHARM